MTVYDRLVAIAAPLQIRGYLRTYEADLTRHDRASLESSRAGDSFVWAIRPCGTELFKVATGRDPVWLTYWLDQGNSRTAPTLCYRVNITRDNGADGAICAISETAARRLARQPAKAPTPYEQFVARNGGGAAFRVNCKLASLA